MQEHFGQSMNLARIKLMALLLHALCVVRTVSLPKRGNSNREERKKIMEGCFQIFVMYLTVNY